MILVCPFWIVVWIKTIHTICLIFRHLYKLLRNFQSHFQDVESKAHEALLQMKHLHEAEEQKGKLSVKLPVTKPGNQSSSLNLQIAISPLSLQEARRPASFGFQETQFTSWLWALVTWATNENTGSSGLAVTSSLKTLTASSPLAVARAPVSWHLGRLALFSQKLNHF